MLDQHRALIYTMIIVSAADSDMPDAELTIIGDIVGHLPVFRDFDRRELPRVLNDCTDLIGREDGLEQTLKAIKAALPTKLRETPTRSPATSSLSTATRRRRSCGSSSLSATASTSTG